MKRLFTILTVILSFCSFPDAAMARERGFKSLFNGKDLSGWMGALDGYEVKDGAIYAKDGFNNIYTEKEYSDFVLRFEFCFDVPGVNSGIGIRTPMGVDAAYHGMCEVQILDHDAPIYKGLRDYQVHGSVYGIAPAKRIRHKEYGQWTSQEIRVEGQHVTVKVDGEVVVDAEVSESIDGYKHPGILNTCGYIGILGHGEGVRFRNIRIKPLKNNRYEN